MGSKNGNPFKAPLKINEEVVLEKVLSLQLIREVKDDLEGKR